MNEHEEYRGERGHPAVCGFGWLETGCTCCCWGLHFEFWCAALPPTRDER